MSVKRKIRDFDLEVKAVDEKGFFSGYASVYGVMDLYREQVVKGAFEKSLLKWNAKGRLPPALWQHDYKQPVGPFTKMTEDDLGLYVEGQLLVDEVQVAREARALMVAKAVTGLSIGFNSIVEEWNKEAKILSLKEIDLWETSIVTFPALEVAQIESVKHIVGDGNVSAREFEGILRDVGFSKTKAKTIVGLCASLLRRDVESETQIDAKSILDEVFRTSINPRELFS